MEMLRQPTDTDQRRQGIVVALKAKQADPDVFLMDVAWIAQIAASGWLERLDEHIVGRYLDAFFPRVVELADRYEGHLVALPVYVDGGLLSKGHPIGATGGSQIRTIVLQLRGEAGPMQVKDPEIGLVHNIGGVGLYGNVTILGRS